MKGLFLILVGLGLSACAVDPYWHGASRKEPAPSLTSEELVWSRDTARQLAFRPRGGASLPESVELPLAKEKGVDVEALIKRLEP